MSRKIGDMNRWIGALTLLAGFGANREAAAQSGYSYYYVAGEGTYTAATNSDVQAPLYLREVSNDATSLLDSESGLSATGFKVTTTVFPSSPAAITGLLGNAGSTPMAFDGAVGPADISSDLASILENVAITDPLGVLPRPQEDGVSDVLLGTLTIHTGAAPDQTTTFTIGPYDPNSGNTYTNNSLYDLDNNLDPGNPTGSATLYASAAATNFSVTTVPEPSTISLLTAMTLVLCLRWASAILSGRSIRLHLSRSTVAAQTSRDRVFYFFVACPVASPERFDPKWKVRRSCAACAVNRHE